MKKNILLLCVFLLSCAFAQDLRQKLQDAESFYLQGLQAEKANDRQKAGDMWNRAVETYNDILATPNFDNAKIRCNLANVHLAQKKLGLAILNYNIALRLEPDNEKIQANLALARSMRKDNLEATEQDKILKTLFAFHYDLPLSARQTIFIAAYILLFAAVAMRFILRKPHAALTTILILASVASATFAASVAVSAFSRESRQGVITASVVHAKAGSSNSYRDAFQAPLHDGAEFTLDGMDDTGQWLHITLPNQADCWIPATAATVLRD